MNLKKLFIFSVVFVLHSMILSAQTNKFYKTATPSLYPDTVNKSVIIINDSEEKNIITASDVQYETKTAKPEPNLSIGKASIVSSPQKAKPNTDAKEKINYT